MNPLNGIILIVLAVMIARDLIIFSVNISTLFTYRHNTDELEASTGTTRKDINTMLIASVIDLIVMIYCWIFIFKH